MSELKWNFVRGLRGNAGPTPARKGREAPPISTERRFIPFESDCKFPEFFICSSLIVTFRDTFKRPPK